jgi:penicillin amidase
VSAGGPDITRRRSPPWRTVAIALVVATAAGVFAAREAAERRALRRALPAATGRLSVQGLEAPISILRDGHGVPHVLARSERDAWFGLGFAQAQDRLGQLTYLARAARGRTAEVLGRDALDVDRWSRTLGFGRLADAQVARLDAPTRSALDAFAAGVGAWVEEVRSGRVPTPLPLARLGVAPEPWRPADSLAIAKLVAWGLDGSVDATLVLSDLIEKLGGFGARPFFPREAAHQLGPDAPDFETRAPGVRDPLRAVLGLAGRSVGSSAWAVGRRDTESGAAIVAGDLHLAPTVPALLYESHLAAPGFEVAGAGVAGVPGFWSGHNGRVAWAATHARAVAADLYLETLDPARPDRYRDESGVRSLAVREERIAVRGGDDVVVRVRETHHGPLLDALLSEGRPPLAVAWGGARAGDGVASLLRVARARNAAELRAALAEHHEPVFAFVYADAEGQGGSQVAGWLPARNMPTGLVPVPGRAAYYDWRGRVPFAELPHAALGEAGFAIAADDALAEGNAIEWWWRPGERARRIEALLRESRARGPIGAGAIAAIQADAHAAGAPARVRALLDLAEPIDGLPPEARLVARHLADWDGSTGADAVGAAMWHVLLGAVVESALEGPLGADLLRRYLALRGVSYEALPDLLLELALAPSPTAEPLVSLDRLRPAVQESLRRTGLTLRVRFGSSPERWQWGMLHLLRFAPFGWPERDWQVAGVASWPYGGDGVTIAVGEYDPTAPFAVRVASVYRWIVDLATPAISLSALAPGASEHPGDPMREEGVARWLAGRPGVLATHRFLVEDGARSRLELTPAAPPAP